MGITLLTSSLVLVVIALSYILLEYYSFKKSEKSNLQTVGLIIASNSSAAIAFDSPHDGAEILAALRANKYITAAALYTAEGKLFARYPDDLNTNSLPKTISEDGYQFKDEYLEGFQSIRQKNLYLGKLYLRADLTRMQQQIVLTATTSLFLIAAVLILAFLLSRFLQKYISRPILELEKTARFISEKGDLSVRAVQRSGDEIGTLTRSFNMMLDQLDSKNLEIHAANEESLKLAAIVESSGDAIIGCNLEGEIITWNQSAERILRYPAEEAIGQKVEFLVPSSEASLFKTMIKDLDASGGRKPVETILVRKGGNNPDISLTLSPVKNSHGVLVGFSLIARDISIQKQNERILAENEEHLRLATQAAELGTFDLDVRTARLVWDKRCKELFGVEDQDEVDYDNTFAKHLHEDDRDRVLKVIDNLLYNRFNNGDYDIEYRTVSPAGKVRWVRAMGKVFFDEYGKPLRFIGAVLDISEKKKEEIRKNDFIAIVSHELKTPLTTMKSFVQILLSKAKIAADEFAINALSRTDAQTNKMTSMIKDFLQLAKLEEGKINIVKGEFALCDLLQDTVAEANLLSSSHSIEVAHSDRGLVLADRDKIGQVLINLLSNAMKYSPAGKKIVAGCIREADHLKVFVKDEGVGISPEDQKHLFKRFYRVDNEKIKHISGFGIGLYLVSEILKYHDSEIRLESEEEKGSTFFFYLKIQESPH
ncbi:PAS domain S-box protein [Desertivirga xinjiangensis]|uniref:PAS domain S-box protein n=1 Tax=Desertivirga xinjiangensis TaxID=539206 RepID=UPI00210AB745|nr:PAS domain S-box protein [Pedobacter xinjiangensis]